MPISRSLEYDVGDLMDSSIVGDGRSPCVLIIFGVVYCTLAAGAHHWHGVGLKGYGRPDKFRYCPIVVNGCLDGDGIDIWGKYWLSKEHDVDEVFHH